MTNNSDKLRGLILAALMVFSVFAGSIALSGSAAATNEGLEGEPLDSGGTFYAGQDVFVSQLNSDETYQIREVNSDDEASTLVRTLDVDTTNATFTLDGSLSDGEFVLVNDTGYAVDIQSNGHAGDVNTNTNDVSAESFEVVTQDLTAEFDEDSVGNSGGSAEVDYEISSNVRTDYYVNISAQGDLDASELNDTFNGAAVNEFSDDDTILVPGDTTYTLNFSDDDAGTYTFDAEVNDTSASDSDDIEVTDTGSADAEFSENVYTEQRGDVVNISVEMDNTDEATVQIGKESNNGYQVAADITDDNNDGVAYLEFNTYLAGNNTSDAQAGETLTAGSETTIDTITNDSSINFNSPRGDDILDAADYNLYVKSGHASGSIDGNADSRGTLSLEDPSVDSMQVWTAPEDSDIGSADAEDIPAYAQGGNLTQTDTVAQNDTVVVQVEASGFEGALVDNPTSSYTAASSTGDLFNLTFEGESVPNQGDDVIGVSDLGDDNVSVVYDDVNDVHFVVIDSWALTDSASNHESGDEYTANFTAYDDNSDLFDDDVSVTGAFDVEDAELELDANADDEIVLEAAAGQEVTGETNLAPGTDVEVTLDSDTSGDPFVKRPEATVQADGTFTAVADFSENNAGSELTADAVFGDVSSDEYDGRLVEDSGQAGTPSPNETTDTAEPMTDTAEPMTDTAEPMTDPAEATDGNESEETATGGSGPGFTAALALIALIAAALLAVRRNN